MTRFDRTGRPTGLHPWNIRRRLPPPRPRRRRPPPFHGAADGGAASSPLPCWPRSWALAWYLTHRAPADRAGRRSRSPRARARQGRAWRGARCAGCAAEHRRRRHGAARRYPGDHRSAGHGDAGRRRDRDAAGLGRAHPGALHRKARWCKRARCSRRSIRSRSRRRSPRPTPRACATPRSSTPRACSSSATRCCSSRIRSRARPSTRRMRW